MISSKEFAKKEKQKEEESNAGQMVIDMKANIKMTKKMERVFIFIIMEIGMKVCGNAVIEVILEVICIKMEIDMMEIGKTIKKMVKVFTIIIMEIEEWAII